MGTRVTYVVEIESDAGWSATKEYECRSVIEALASARIDIADHPNCFITAVWQKDDERREA
jgi:hypothetical protein